MGWRHGLGSIPSTYMISLNCLTLQFLEIQHLPYIHHSFIHTYTYIHTVIHTQQNTNAHLKKKSLKIPNIIRAFVCFILTGDPTKGKLPTTEQYSQVHPAFLGDKCLAINLRSSCLNFSSASTLITILGST